MKTSIVKHKVPDITKTEVLEYENIPFEEIKKYTDIPFILPKLENKLKEWEEDAKLYLGSLKKVINLFKNFSH